MKNELATYSTSSDVLYKVCNDAWNRCSQYLPQFSALKSSYTSDVIAAALKDVVEAKAMATSLQTITDRKAARENLMEITRQLQGDWQLLKTYIIAAFSKTVVKTKLEAAGATLYTKASVDNWSGVSQLIDAANTFIANNLDVLTANGNMPADFPVTLQATADSCTAAADIFFYMDQAKKEATINKINANNLVYQQAAGMLRDGRLIFKNDIAVKRQFTFSRLVATFQGEGSASLRGKIINNLGAAAAGATITSKDGQYTATANSKGHYRINRVAEGSYTFIISCAGYTPVEQVITFKAGTATTANIELGGLMKKVA